jgi:hypothetical protein
MTNGRETFRDEETRDSATSFFSALDGEDSYSEIGRLDDDERT